ncbi:cyclic pyranopterin monophosphate synthase MoaC [Alteromonas ponticola]|uniref:Cyclic pyranopterin monophosphate synthase n=1 Tax=Alteromonas ponticola TaxID=2720613 RepID=A0ABX1R434_9ALTE|nr:cyclic pyranopterin monophosphate synthase MoaC [Alteromonas ponticola]
MSDFSHVDGSGKANMVDISSKEVTVREARATGFLMVSAEVITGIKNNALAKGDVLAVARIAGIQGAKRCSDMIPLCHPLSLTKVQIDFEIDEAASRIHAYCECKLSGQTGVEMEALSGVTTALLTLFDMCKAVDPAMQISQIHVVEKKGGKSGHYLKSRAKQS